MPNVVLATRVLSRAFPHLRPAAPPWLPALCHSAPPCALNPPRLLGCWLPALPRALDARRASSAAGSPRLALAGLFGNPTAASRGSFLFGIP